jgi:hypothetical protein
MDPEHEKSAWMELIETALAEQFDGCALGLTKSRPLPHTIFIATGWSWDEEFPDMVGMIAVWGPIDDHIRLMMSKNDNAHNIDIYDSLLDPGFDPQLILTEIEKFCEELKKKHGF